MSQPDDTLLMLNAFQDGELSPSEAIEISRRLDSEPELRAMADRLGRLSGRLGETFAQAPVSPLLRGRVVRGLGLADPVPRRSWTLPLQSIAAMLLVAVLGGGLVGGGATYLAVGGGDGVASEQEGILAGHLRALEAPQPFDVASSNRHVVKPWFNGRTTIAPQVLDLADQGFPLIGGRIDIVDGKAVPTMVYKHDQHVISVTVVPHRSSLRDGNSAQDGYGLDRWTVGDLTYWFVSDIDRAALQNFEHLFRAQVLAG